MAINVRIPTPLRTLTGGADEVPVAGATVREVIDNLEKKHPGLKERLCDEKGVRLNFPRLEGPRPLAALYFLDRWGPEGETSIEPIDELDPERLLAASYNFAIRTPERMLR